MGQSNGTTYTIKYRLYVGYIYQRVQKVFVYQEQLYTMYVCIILLYT